MIDDGIHQNIPFDEYLALDAVNIVTTGLATQTLTAGGLVTADVTAGGLTLTLPDAGTAGLQTLTVMKTDAGINTVSFAAAAGDTILGAGAALAAQLPRYRARISMILSLPASFSFCSRFFSYSSSGVR